MTKRTERIEKKKILEHYQLYLFIAPAIILTLIFAYIPMITNVIAFQDYDIFGANFGFSSKFVGLDNFKFLSQPWFYKLFWRTFSYSATLFVTGMPLPILLTLLLNELHSQKYRKFVQTVSYIPHFVSWVLVAGLVYTFLSTDPSGFINNIKILLFGGERISFMQNPDNFLPYLVITNIWKEVGWATIIYFAAITGISPELYEAAAVDGASRFKRCLHITLPALIPTFSIMLILSIGGLFSTNFDQIFNLQNQVIRTSTDTLNTWIYFKGILNREYSLSAAVGLFNGLICMTLIISTNFITKKLNNTSLF